MTVEELIQDLSEWPLTTQVFVAVEHVEGHEVLLVKNGIDKVKFEDNEVIIELG